MGTTSPAHEDRRRSIELLLNLNSTKISDLESALERNWLIHVILSGVGVAMIFNIGHLRDVLAKYFSQPQYNAQAVAAVVLPVFLYHFMRLGQLLTAFNEARQLRDDLLKDYLGRAFPSLNIEPLHQSTSFLAESLVKTGNWPYLLVTTATVTIAQASALFLVLQAYGVNRFSVVISVVSLILLLILYVLFWKFQKDRRRATLVISLSFGCFLLVLGLLIAFAKLSYQPLP